MISERTAELKTKSNEIEASYQKLSETGATLASRVNEVQIAIDSVASVSERNRITVEKVNANTLEVGTRIEELSALAQSLNVHQQLNN